MSVRLELRLAALTGLTQAGVQPYRGPIERQLDSRESDFIPQPPGGGGGGGIMSGRLELLGHLAGCLSSDPHTQKTSEAAVRAAAGTPGTVLCHFHTASDPTHQCSMTCGSTA